VVFGEPEVDAIEFTPSCDWEQKTDDRWLPLKPVLTP
jgi:hypothetical protein